MLFFIKKEPVLSAAALLAVVSMFFVHPSSEYLSYIDFRTLALLFSLMTVVAGLKEIGLFRYLGSSLLAGLKSTRQLALTLTALCFFSSMLVTNDVSLITFVPFSVLILNMAGLPELLIPVIRPADDRRQPRKYGNSDRKPAESVSVFHLRTLRRNTDPLHAAAHRIFCFAPGNCRISSEEPAAFHRPHCHGRVHFA